MVRTFVGALAVIALSVSVFGVEQTAARGQGKGGGQTVCAYCGPTAATFTPGGDIGDDGEGPYVHGDAGLRATIENTGQWAMKLNYYRFSGARRTAYIDLTSPVVGQLPNSNVDKVHQTSAFYVSVFAIGQMVVGETKLTGGNGSFVEGKKTYWFWFTTANGHQGTPLSVTRVSATQWSVEAVPGTVAEVTDGVSTHVGNYNVAFMLTIDKL